MIRNQRAILRQGMDSGKITAEHLQPASERVDVCILKAGKERLSGKVNQLSCWTTPACGIGTESHDSPVGNRNCLGVGVGGDP